MIAELVLYLFIIKVVCSLSPGPHTCKASLSTWKKVLNIIDLAIQCSHLCGTLNCKQNKLNMTPRDTTAFELNLLLHNSTKLHPCVSFEALSLASKYLYCTEKGEQECKNTLK